jgi:hypothetical protein
MTDFTPPPLPVSEPASRRSHNLWWIILLCIAGLALLAASSFGIYKLVSTHALTLMPQDDQTQIQNTLDKFMQALAKKDVDSAYAMLSASGQKQAPKAKMRQMVQGTNFTVFEDYQSTEIEQLSVSQSFNGGQSQNQHTVQAYVAGYFHYSDGVKRRFTASLVKEEDTWKIDTFSVDWRPVQEQQLQGPIS